IVRELELAVRWQRPYILFAVYSSEYVRSDAQSQLENQIIDLGQEIEHLRVMDAKKDGLFRSLLQCNDLDEKVFFVEGLRWGHTDDESIYRSLNQNRELFRDYGLRTIFWLTENEIADLAHLAPDFWALRHGMVEFSESPTPQQVMQKALDSAWQGTGEYAGQFDDTDEKILLRENLLTDMPRQDETSSIRANMLLTLGLLNWRKGDFEKADGQLREALKLAARFQDNWFEAECYNAIALIKTGLGRNDDAIDAYKQAISLAPDQIFAWNNLGNLCTRIGRNDEALVTFMKAIDCNAQDPIAWNGLGTVYYRIGYADDAVTAFRKAIQFLPTFSQPWNGLGEVYASVGRTEDAIKAFQQAIQLNKLYLAPWLHLADLYARQDRNRDAVKAYQRALQLDPRNSEVWNELGLIFSKTDAFEEAEEAFTRAIEIDHGFGQAYSNLGLLHSQQGQFKDAIAMLTRSLELLKDARDQSAAWNRLGDVRRQMNQYEAAMFAYQKADALNSSPVPAEMPEASAVETLESAPAETTPEPEAQPDPVDAIEEAVPEEAATHKPVQEVTVETAEVSDAPAWIFNPQKSEVVELGDDPELPAQVSEVEAQAAPEPVVATHIETEFPEVT
ncbi:MAG TPA: tetratricopeptide repeat protein, partial [Anaerolineales bacterium]